MRGSLIRAAIALAVTSVMLTIIMFHFDAPLAGVFELSVCAGLITVIFMSTISLAKAQTYEEAMAESKGRLRRYWVLPVLLIGLGGILALVTLPLDLALPPQIREAGVQEVLWNDRQLDLTGQIVVLLTGVFAVVVLFKEKQKSRKDI
jgi:NADH-quinone oxidoreductase subunit J